MAESSADMDRDAAFARLAERFDFSIEAVRAMSAALTRGNGRMAQFDHPDFGGHGQWMLGGMVMIGDMFNDGLKARVSALCQELSDLRASPATQTRSSDGAKAWWPDELGHPQSAGGQNDVRYAYFAGAHRLAVDRGGTVMVYDTGDHEIFGVAQQQSHDTTLAFTSQHGPVDVDKLRRV